jgi:hypothetical protein
MNDSAESDAEAGARVAEDESRKTDRELEVLKMQLELRKVEIAAQERIAVIGERTAQLELRTAQLELRKAEIDAQARAEAKAKKEAESFIASGEFLHSSQVSKRFPDIHLNLTLAITIVLSTITHSLIFCFFMDALGTEFLESIRPAWVARFLTTLKSSGLYQVIVFMFEFLSRVGKRLLLKSQTANTPVSDEMNPLISSDNERPDVMQG